jgi:outer membrane protein TolC
VAALERTVKAASRTLQLAIGLYRDGLQDFQSVLDAQRSLFEFDNQLAQAQGQASANLVALYQALGGGWRPGGAAAAPEDDRS